ncbi:MAG: hypothetical protein ACTSVM_05695 [Candidatus Ranarchaeia archaeon]
MIPFIIAGVAFAIGFVGYYLVASRRHPINEKILDEIIEHFLTRSFTAGDLINVAGLAPQEVKDALPNLVSRGILKKRNSRYQTIVPLFFLDDRQYQKAMRLTANDEILYGATQQPFLSHFHLLAFYGVIPLSMTLGFLGVMGLSPNISSFVSTYFGYLDIHVLFIFFVLLSIIVVDAVENVVKSWAQERFSVIVGAKSGIYYDEEYATELSGRIPRGKIGQVSIKISLLQKILNFFSDVPHGDIIVKVRGKRKAIRFRNMPFPRELFFVLRRVQLKGLGWRKRHARTLMMWRTKSLIPTVGGR